MLSRGSEYGVDDAEAARVPVLFDKRNDPGWLYVRFTAGHGEQAIAG